MEAIAQAQAAGGTGALIDADQCIDPRIAERLGVDIERVYFSQPECFEDAWETISRLVSDDVVDVVAVDSIAALLPRDYHRKPIDELPLGSTIPVSLGREDGEFQNLVAMGLKTLIAKLSRSRAAVLMTNHIVEKIGVMFGSPETTPWPTQPLKYYASVRVDLRRIGQLKDGERSLGQRVRLKVTKNRLSAPFRQAESDMFYGEGFCPERDWLDLAIEQKLIRRSGGWFSYGEHTFGPHREKAVEYLKDNPSITDELKTLITDKLS